MKVKNMVIETQAAKADSWKSNLADKLNFDPETEKLAIDILTRAHKQRDEAVANFAQWGTRFSIRRFMIDNCFHMSKAKALGYTFKEFADTLDVIDAEGYIGTIVGATYRCEQTDESVFISSDGLHAELTSYFR